ncbi:hypothetical protein DBR06_SOUSAS110559, partial [Sousa chinensis]
KGEPDEALEQRQNQRQDLRDERVRGIETAENGTNLTSNCLISLEPEQSEQRDKFSVSDIIRLGSESLSLLLEMYPSKHTFSCSRS